jgi:5'-deoxynucleotidase YfbR-like HD superfamily hydrolase
LLKIGRKLVLSGCKGDSVNLAKLEKLYAAGDVKRLHTVPTCQVHTISEHVYGSMLIAMELCDDLNLAPGNVLHTLLYHDAPEVYTGDIPAPAKRADADLHERLSILEAKFYKEYGISFRTCSPLEYTVIHAADIADLAMCCIREKRMGNRTQILAEVFGNCANYLKEYKRVEPIARLTEALLEMWLYAGV